MMNRFLIQATIVFIIVLMQISCADGPNRNIEKNLFVTNSSLEMIVGDEFQIVASPTSQTFTWTSSNTGVATVSSTGLVKAVSDGVCIILVISNEGLKREIPVDVAAYLPLKGIDVYNPVNLAPVTELSLLLGQSIKLSANPSPSDYNEKIPFNIVWKSSDPKIATVDEKTGEIKAVDFGNAIITVSSVEKPSVKTEIAVSIKEIPIIEIQTIPSLNLVLDQTVTVTTSFIPENYSVKDASLQWASSNKSVVTVTEDGAITAIATGSATITVSLKANPSVMKDIPVTVQIPFIDVATFTDAGNNLVYSKVFLAKDKEINVIGLNAAAIAIAYNRDFMNYDGTKLIFTGETGEWDVYYSAKYNYFWIARMDDVAPTCYWIVGAGFSCASVWNDDFFSGGWSTSNMRQMAYMRSIGNEKYQTTININFPDGDTFAVFANRAWGGQVGGITLTSDPPGIELHPNVSDVWKNKDFIPGYYRFIYDKPNKTYDFVKVD